MSSLDDIRGSLHQKIRGSASLQDLKAVLEDGVRQINALLAQQPPQSPNPSSQQPSLSPQRSPLPRPSSFNNSPAPLLYLDTTTLSPRTTSGTSTTPKYAEQKSTTPKAGSVPQPRPSAQKVEPFSPLERKMDKRVTLGGEDELRAKYEIKEEIELGRGATAVVKLCIERKTEAELAVKIITKKNSLIDLEKFHEEVSILAALKHPNIIQLHDCYESEDFIYLITDLAFGGELFDRILQMKFFGERDCQNIARKLFAATTYFHQKGIAHRDLKPENILFANLEEDSDVKISDFGFAARLVQAPGKDKGKKGGRRGTLLGTKGYAAPEVFTGLYDQKCDVWSLGVIIYIMLCGVPPFVEVGHDDQPEYTPFWIYQNKMQTVPDKGVEFPERFWKHVTSLAREFLAAVLEADPEKRISAADALKHPWLTQAPKGAESKNNLLTQNSEVYRQTVQAIQQSDYRSINRAPFVPGLDASLQEKLAAKWDPGKAQKVQEWISQMLGVRAGEGQTLQQWLMDGVHLCNLVNRIQPGTIKKINPGKGPFVQRENIAQFLNAIASFGLRQEDLFVTINLYEGTNMVSVVNTLFALALRCKFIKGFTGPFINETRRVSLSSKERTT